MGKRTFRSQKSKHFVLRIIYDEADHEAVRKRIERAEKVVQSFEVNDKGMPDKGFQEMYEIQEELARLETDITNSLSGMREEYQPRFHR